MFLMKIIVTKRNGDSLKFELSKAALTPNDTLGLDKIVDALRENETGWSDIRIEIENRFGEPS